MTRRFAHGLLLGVALFAVLGHVCALPFHAHAGTIASHEGRDSHHGGEPAGADAVHAASCEALKAGGADLPVVLDLSGTLQVGTAPVPRRALQSEDIAIAVASPPLFLLHASLLI